ncbi:MAG: hypothetical protein ACI857_003024 [Arenicella sp.]|jgi:hypothetical protein
MRSIILISISIIFSSLAYGKTYFKFDEVIHYRHTIGELEFEEMDARAAENKTLYRLLSDQKPAKLSKEGFEESLSINGYQKRILDKSRMDSLKTMLVPKKNREYIGESCIVAFRDILIFKNKGKLRGIIKICFWCGNVWPISKKGEIDFGSYLELRRLGKILSY